MLQSVLFVGSWFASVLQELALWVGALLLLASVLSAYVGWKQRRKALLVGETPRSEAADVRSPGVVRVRGTVVPNGEKTTFTSPFGSIGTVLHPPALTNDRCQVPSRSEKAVRMERCRRAGYRSW
ncbi:hypothetical protein [Natrinema sp. SYSU A 869]|uniref:hypothetical protein n=1 Tax=Natrinema sp. SYSU A 869 TaxID=2871694 RepID=UPI001CA4012F|nr:hypothetical protein [Natrinema sp. SYSU A 869]